VKRIPLQSMWRVFASRYQLSDHQLQQFRDYAFFLKDWNDRINLTAIDDEHDIIDLHFDDSLQVTHCIDFSRLKSTCDVGTGGGFPGIPLKILFPHMSIFLVEVTKKKIAFLEHIVEQLGLSDVEIVALDWRTFLRKTTYNIDLFCSRASLDPVELIRMFKPSCYYNNRALIYWASRMWQATPKVVPFCQKEWIYHSSGRQRRLIKLGVPR
jgi:16S rRNA (guanine(527)-N(7))-methyltransferase RsmG